ncbi:transcription activator of gluconeogenesis [Phaeosphaeriaceae sp. PMI808]|nr:transcription activator of gluconeogenesis [Phaeosphaeriaceae sp. PMI808]
MASPDAHDASLSPDYSGDLDDDMAVEQKSDDGSPPQNDGNQKSASNAKDPLRPRRKKARRACFACQRAHLTCGDERPCNRCIKRGLQDHCMDGVRKKAKYLHDAPEGALMPGVGGHYPYMNGNRPTPIPSQDPQTVAMSSPGNLYTQAPQGTFYPPPTAPMPLPPSQEGQNFSNQQSPISPQFSQAHHSSSAHATSSMPQVQPSQLQQFGPLFDPSDPALFNFDISSLNFGNHYGALEFGMLGHMSSGAADAPNDNSMMTTMNQNPNMYGSHMPGGYPTGISFGPNGMPSAEWQDSQSHQGSMHVHTPSSATATATIDQNGNRQDSINGPHAFAIGQGPASHATASPASTDASTFENDNPLSNATFFANANRPQPQRSPTLTRQHQDNRQPSTALQPIHSNGARKRHRDTKRIYQGIKKPHDYVTGFHRLFQLCNKKLPRNLLEQAKEYLKLYRPGLIAVHGEMNTDDLIHQEMGLQRNLMTLQEHFAEVGTPFLICRRSGEIVGCNKEFTILTGWRCEVLLGQEPNLNVNLGNRREADESELSTRTNTTPNLTGQEVDTGIPTVNVVQLMDANSALEYLQHFSELCWQDPHGHAKQRVNMLRYQTKSEFDRIQEMKANADHKSDALVKMEGGAVHQGESAMQRLGAKNGMVDCMIWWHIKRDTFEMPYLVCMSVMPVLDKGLQ